MMRIAICFILFIVAGKVWSQDELNTIYGHKRLQLKERKIYIFCRATTTKAGMLAQSFNRFDTNITHVGIGYFQAGKTYIYHVSDNAAHGRTALTIDSLESFIIPRETYYISIWESDNTAAEFGRFTRLLMNYAKHTIIFDPFFNIGNDDTLYCSEFCASVLNGVGGHKFRVRPSSLMLNNRMYESYLQRKRLIYFPVDFFESSKYFHQVFSARL